MSASLRDYFTLAVNLVQARLLAIHRETKAHRLAHQEDAVVLAITRSDYMLDGPSTSMLQVQILRTFWNASDLENFLFLQHLIPCFLQRVWGLRERIGCKSFIA